MFVHTCYINAAKDLYEDPHVISDEMKISERNEVLNRRFTKCIKDAIDSLVPTEEILKTYLTLPDTANFDIDEEGEEAAEPEETEPVQQVVEDPLDPLGEDPLPQDAPMAPEGGRTRRRRRAR